VPQHQRAVDALRPRLNAGAKFLIAASVYAEILVRPLQRGDDDAVDQFIVAIDATLVPLDRSIARCAARLRGSHQSLRQPDAISPATALITGAEFVTLDHRLRRAADLEGAST
jgi:predicted nucleic acid-binding protein